MLFTVLLALVHAAPITSGQINASRSAGFTPATYSFSGPGMQLNFGSYFGYFLFDGFMACPVTCFPPTITPEETRSLSAREDEGYGVFTLAWNGGTLSGVGVNLDMRITSAPFAANIYTPTVITMPFELTLSIILATWHQQALGNYDVLGNVELAAHGTATGTYARAQYPEELAIYAARSMVYAIEGGDFSIALASDAVDSPEPATWLLVAMGLTAVCARRFIRRLSC